MPGISSPHSRRVRPEMPTPTIGNEETTTVYGFDAYCRPVEVYNILRHRAKNNPTFLNRNLSYRIEAKNKSRVKMSINLCCPANGGLQVKACMVLGRRVSDPSTSEDIAMYRFKRACILKELNGGEATSSSHANFILPEIYKLAMEAKSGSYYLLVISNAGTQSPQGCSDHIANCDFDTSYLSSCGGRFCLVGKISLESLFNLLERSPNLNLWQGVDITTTVDLCPCNVKIDGLKKNKCVAVARSQNLENKTNDEQVQLSISLEALGANDKSLYSSHSCENRSSFLGRIVGLRIGNVIFNYRYHHNKIQTEVTQDFSCPFCLVKCGSFKGLQEHLFSSHDLFNFESLVTESFQAITLSLKADFCKYEDLGFGVDPRKDVFYFCSKRRRHKLPKDQNERHVYPLDLDLPCDPSALMDKAKVSTSMSHLYPDPKCFQSVSGNNLTPTLSQLAKTKKQLVEPSDPRNCELLKKRRFFHSQRAQPMALEQILDDYDSEDDIDNDVADFEDRRMLDDFVDVTKDEKQIMHLWNSFVRRQRVLADGHIPWACEAFSRLHQPDFVRVPGLKWCWRVVMIKLWNHGLLDGRTINTCNTIINQSNNQDPDDTST